MQPEGLRDNLKELLLTHHVGGHWRAPLSGQMRDVLTPSGAPLGRLVEAGDRDLARAMAAARRAAPALSALPAGARAALAGRFARELALRAEALTAARQLEGLAVGLAADPVALPDLGPLPPGPIALLGTVAAPPALLAGALAAALRAGRPVLLKPAPRAPVAPLVLVEALRAAGVPPGAVALLQGGGAATGAPLLALPGLGGALLVGKPTARAAIARPGLRPVAPLG